MFRILISLCIFGTSIAATVFQGGVPFLDGRIVGGENVDIKEYPFQGLLFNNGWFSCGCSILNNITILTAAHCVEDVPTNSLTVAVGSSTRGSLGNNSQVVSVRKIIVHNKYDSNSNDYDVAVLKLEKHLVFNEFVQIIPLAKERPKDGTPVKITGWGTTSLGGSLPDILQAVIVNVVNQQICSNAYLDYNRQITNRMICAGINGGGKGPCHGDSGGPMISNDTIVGIVSWGAGCAENKYPAVFGSVADLWTWIIQQL